MQDAERDQARLREMQRALNAGQVAAAGSMAETALADGLEHVMVLSLVASRREAQGRLDEAMALLRRAKAAAPDTVGVINAIGLYLSRTGRFAEAVAEYDQALAINPRFAKALANRGMALVALARLNEAHMDFEAAAKIDPGNLLAINGLAGLALRRGAAGEARRLAEQVLAGAPDHPAALLIHAGADVEERRAADAEATLRRLLAGTQADPFDRAMAWGLLGDALDAQQRFAEAFGGWGEANAQMARSFRETYAGRPDIVALIRGLAATLAGRNVPPGKGSRPVGPAREHVFLLGFPRSGTTLIEQVLEQHPDVTTMAEKDCLTEASRAWLTNEARFAAFCEADSSELEPYRAAYWRGVAAQGIDPAGRVFVDKNPFFTFKLPLIARLFPDARILFARRDPRDIVLSCFRHRFQMSDPVYAMLTLEGVAALYAAAMALAAVSERVFDLHMRSVVLESVIADFDAETKDICAFVGIDWRPELRDFAAHVGGRGVFTPSGPQLARGLNSGGIGKWRNYAAQLAPILPLLDPYLPD